MLALLAEFMGGFAYGLVAIISETCKNALQRRGEITSINMGIYFEVLAIDAYRFLTFVCYPRILPLRLTTSLLEIWFRASSVSLGDLASGTFGLFDSPFVPCEQLPIVPRHLVTLYPTWWRGYSVGYKGEYLENMGIPFSVENGMKSNYGVWIWLGKIRNNFRRKWNIEIFDFECRSGYTKTMQKHRV
jgi:hypothetical protein